jgi:hypothetical protein
MSHQSLFERIVNVAKALVEILAILVGGYWTYDKFIRTEAPALAPNLRLESGLVWHKLERKSPCLAEVTLQVTNRSKSEITVRKVVRRAWFVEKPKTLSKAIVHFDPMRLGLGPAVDQEEYKKDGPFIQTYAPEASSQNAFVWFVENKPDTYSLFRIDLYANEQDKEPLDYHLPVGSNLRRSGAQRQGAQPVNMHLLGGLLPNITFDRTAGSHSLAAAGQRGRYYRGTNREGVHRFGR